MLDRRWRGGVERGLGPARRSAAPPRRQRRRPHGVRPARLGRRRRCSSRTGHHGWAVVGVIVAGVSDLLDGAIARGSGQASPRGAFFDSVADRVSDALLLGGARGGSRASRPYLPVLAFAVGRAARWSSRTSGPAPRRSGINARGGLMERAERFVFLEHRPRVRHPRPGALGDARAHRVHRRRPVPAGVPAGGPAAAAAHDVSARGAATPTVRRAAPGPCRWSGGPPGASTAAAGAGTGPRAAARARRSAAHVRGRADCADVSRAADASRYRAARRRRRRLPASVGDADRASGDRRAAAPVRPISAHGRSPPRRAIGVDDRRGRRRVRLLRAVLVRDAAAARRGRARRGAGALHDRGLRAHPARASTRATA